jgi:GNAT superfamily N-acetyltransferase
MSYTIRPATLDDVQNLTSCIERSARALSNGYYTPQETEAAIRWVYGVDRTLIEDGTYFIVESETGELAGCGGWSRRRKLFGGDQHSGGENPLLDPATEPAKIRAFFVTPEHARRGVGKMLLTHCSAIAAEEGFQRLELMATLPGVPFYREYGFREVEPVREVLPDGTTLSFVKMERATLHPSNATVFSR